MYSHLEAFVRAHQPCGEMTAEMTPPDGDGYLVSVTCSCGMVFERWVTPEVATADLIGSGLPCLPNGSARAFRC
jgi:hypothetical protein